MGVGQLVRTNQLIGVGESNCPRMAECIRNQHVLNHMNSRKKVNIVGFTVYNGKFVGCPGKFCQSYDSNHIDFA